LARAGTGSAGVGCQLPRAALWSGEDPRPVLELDERAPVGSLMALRNGLRRGHEVRDSPVCGGGGHECVVHRSWFGPGDVRGAKMLADCEGGDQLSEHVRVDPKVLRSALLATARWRRARRCCRGSRGRCADRRRQILRCYRTGAAAACHGHGEGRCSHRQHPDFAYCHNFSLPVKLRKFRGHSPAAAAQRHRNRHVVVSGHSVTWASGRTCRTCGTGAWSTDDRAMISVAGCAAGRGRRKRSWLAAASAATTGDL
jgi:hypothetical protein